MIKKTNLSIIEISLLITILVNMNAKFSKSTILQENIVKNKITVPRSLVETEPNVSLLEIPISVLVVLDLMGLLAWMIWMNANKNLVGMESVSIPMEATRKLLLRSYLTKILYLSFLLYIS